MNNSNQWRVIPMDIHGWSIHDAEGNEIVKDIYDQEVAEQIVREHNSHGALVGAITSRATNAANKSGLGVSEWRAFLSERERAALALADKDS